MTQWRTWLSRRSRDMTFLWKCSAAIVGGAVLLAALLQALRQHDDRDASGTHLLLALEDTRYGTAHDYRRLAGASKPQPEELAEWVRGVSNILEEKDAMPWTFDASEWRVGDMELRPLLERHVPDLEQRELFQQFIRSSLSAPGVVRDEARRQVHEAALKEPPLRFAGEFEGDLHLRDKKPAEALPAYLREVAFEDAVRARHMAFTTALALKDAPALRRLCADARCARETDAILLYKAAILLNDRWLILRYLTLIQWQHWSFTLMVPLALFAAAVWYLILVHSASRERLRWLRYLSPVFAGVMSVWLLQWGQSSLNYSMPGDDDAEGTPMEELFGYVVHVGVPEETVKLCLFALFVPLLVRHGSASKAALTAGCVGLGFALDENLLYYPKGSGVAVSRLVTANFMHIAMTGLIGLWFYEMIRSRFHRAGEFIVVFAGVVLAHGVYDFASTQAALNWGVDMASIIILAVLARMYLHSLKPRGAVVSRQVISSSAIFFIGLALVVAGSILAAVWQTDSMIGATEVLKKTLAIIPVAVLFVREFREA